MENKWKDSAAKAAIKQYNDVHEDIALRVYTSRLIGADPSLVLHGGGNTSVKSRTKSLTCLLLVLSCPFQAFVSRQQNYILHRNNLHLLLYRIMGRLLGTEIVKNTIEFYAHLIFEKNIQEIYWHFISNLE